MIERKLLEYRNDSVFTMTFEGFYRHEEYSEAINILKEELEGDYASLYPKLVWTLSKWAGILIEYKEPQNEEAVAIIRKYVSKTFNTLVEKFGKYTLDFIGIGSAFNTEIGNTSAFIRKKDSLLLLDCGGTVFHRMTEIGLLTDLKKLYIIISHTHPDHVGSLGEVIFYSYYILKHKPKVFFAEPELMKSFLSTIGVSSEMYLLEGGIHGHIADEQLGELGIEFLSITHVDTIPAYGFTITQKNRPIYYSGDANYISPTILEKLKRGELDRLYQDTCGLDYEGNSHLSLRRLCDMIEPEFRNRVYCMHLDKHISENEIMEKGFNIAPVYIFDPSTI